MKLSDGVVVYLDGVGIAPIHKGFVGCQADWRLTSAAGFQHPGLDYELLHRQYGPGWRTQATTELTGLVELTYFKRDLVNQVRPPRRRPQHPKSDGQTMTAAELIAKYAASTSTSTATAPVMMPSSSTGMMSLAQNPSKADLTIEKASVIGDVSNGSQWLAEAIYDPKLSPPVQFAVTTGTSPAPKLYDQIREIIPPRDPFGMIQKGVVRLPSGPALYISDAQLQRDIVRFIHRYCDLPEFWEELVAHYAQMSWVYDRFTALGYLRFLGEPQTGKTRCAQVAANLCYKSIMASGATSSAPVFRLLEVYEGTLFIDEAEFRDSDKSNDIIKILNAGYITGTPVLRCEKDSDTYNTRSFNVYGPKILSNREPFKDEALESRCLTYITPVGKLRRDVPRSLPDQFAAEALDLRNKLLQWRFDNFFNVTPDESKLLDLEPRLTQLATPLYSVSQDAQFQQSLVDYLGERGRTDREESQLAGVVAAIDRLVTRNGHTVLVKAVVAEYIAEETAPMTSNKASHLVRSLGFKTEHTRIGSQFAVAADRLEELKAKYGV